MRIAHVTATFPPYGGGTGYVCYYQARELARLGHEVRVLTAGMTAPRAETLDGIIVRRLRSVVSTGNVPVLPGLVGALNHCDVIHLHAPFILGAELTALASRVYSIPLVVTYHNDLVANGSWRDRAYSLATRSLRQILTHQAAKVLFVSEGHADTNDMRSLAHSGKRQVLPNGVDLARFRPGPDRAETRRRLRIPHDVRLVGFVGGLDPAHHYKGLDILLHAMSRDDLRQFYLLVVGDGSLRAGFEAQSERLGVAPRVHFAGAAGHHELPSLYRACDILAAPSVAPEAFSLVVLEALACGIPVIASRSPGPMSLLDHGRTGLLVQSGNADELADAISLLGTDDELRRRLADNGYQRVALRHGWEHIGIQLECIYQSVLDQQRLVPAAS